MVTEPASPSFVTDFRKARAALRLDTRQAILAAAAKVLSHEGPSALTIRRVAQAVNASTKVVYTTFGGKDGLLDALYLHSFAGLERALKAQCAITDPAARLRAMSLAYRRYALSEPSFYNVMFGDLGRAYEAPPASRRQAKETFRILRDTVEACLPQQQRAGAARATRLLWAAMHGVMSLDMRGLLSDAANSEPLFNEAVDAVRTACGLFQNSNPA